MAIILLSGLSQAETAWRIFSLRWNGWAGGPILCSQLHWRKLSKKGVSCPNRAFIALLYLHARALVHWVFRNISFSRVLLSISLRVLWIILLFYVVWVNVEYWRPWTKRLNSTFKKTIMTALDPPGKSLPKFLPLRVKQIHIFADEKKMKKSFFRHLEWSVLTLTAS